MPDNNKRYKLFGDVVRLIGQTPSTTTYKTSNGIVQRISTRTFREKAEFVSPEIKDSNFTVSVLNELELAKKAEAKELAYRRLDKARNKIDEAEAKNYLPNEVVRMNERLKQVTIFIDKKFMKTKDAPLFNYVIKGSKYKDKIKIDITDNYFDKSDYAFYNPSNGELTSYNNVATSFVQRALNAVGLKPKDIKVGFNKTFKNYGSGKNMDSKVKDTNNKVEVIEEYRGHNNPERKYHLKLNGREVVSNLMKSEVEGWKKALENIKPESTKIKAKDSKTYDANAYRGVGSITRGNVNSIMYNLLETARKSNNKAEVKKSIGEVKALLRTYPYGGDENVSSFSTIMNKLGEAENRLKTMDAKGSKTVDAEMFNGYDEILWKSSNGKIIVTRNIRDKNSKYDVRDVSKGMGNMLKEFNTLNEAISFAKLQKTSDVVYAFTYKVKIGADMKTITVNASNEEEAKKKVQQEAKKLISKYKGDTVRTKWD